MNLNSTIFYLTLLFGSYITEAYCFSEKDKAYCHASSRAAKIIEKEFGIHCCGTGCKTNKFIEMIALSFQVKRELHLDEARNLIVPIVNRFISILNEDALLKPHMVKYPFDHENVEVVLFFMTKRNGDVFHPKMQVASFYKTKFNFYNSHKNDPYSYIDDIYETYEEAIEKVVTKKPRPVLIPQCTNDCQKMD